MRTDTAAFYEKNTALDKKPRYTIEIAFDTANTILHYFTSHSDSAIPTGANVTYSVISGLGGSSQTINPDKAVSTIGNISFSVVDKSNAVRDLQYTKYQLGYSLRGMRVRVYLGYKDLDWADYSLIQTQIIDSVSYDKGQYNFKCSDVQRLTRKDIFDPVKTNLAAKLTDTATTITVYSASEFVMVAHGTSYSDAPSATVGYVRIDDEIIRYTGKTATTFTGCTRGVFNTKVVEHTIDPNATADRRTRVEEFIYLEMPAVKLIYALLTGDIYEPENLITYSEQFDHAYWIKQNITITADDATAPDGTVSAEKAAPTSVGYIIKTNISVTGSATYTFSVWAKVVGADQQTSINIYKNGTGAGHNREDIIITSEWKRFSTTLTVASDTTLIHCYPIDNRGTYQATQVYIWGAQLVKGTDPGRYYKTEATALIPSYSTLPTSWHLGISTNYVRRADFTGILADWWDTSDDTLGVSVRFEGLEKEDGKKFIETELLLLLGAFMPVYTDGAIGLKRMVRILTDAPYSFILNENNVISHSELTHDFPSLHNVIKIDWNYNAIKDSTTRSSILLDSDSIAVHGKAKRYDLTFNGLHAEVHTQATLNNRFDALRDRYSGPPLRFKAVCHGSRNTTEVGDIARVKLGTVQDFITGTTLDRSFEVQNVAIDWITGRVSLSMFSSSQEAAPIEWSGNATNLDDSFYTSEGHDLATYVGGGYDAATDFQLIGGVGHIKTSCQFTGASTTGGAIFYYDGPLQIDAAITVTITQNVQIRCKGFFTLNGIIDGAGNGLAGAAGATTYNQFSDGWHSPGQAGIGSTQAGGGYKVTSIFYANYSGSADSKATVGGNIPKTDLINETNSIGGLPAELRGTSGGGGHPAYDGFPDTTVLRAAGGAGGAGGAGLLIICRGVGFGGSANIDLSGSDGIAGSTFTLFGSRQGYAGTGAGGYPGALYIVNDGTDVVDQITNNIFTANRGSTIPTGTPLPKERFYADPLPFYSYYVGFYGIDRNHWASNYRVNYIPADETAEPDQTEYPPDVTNFTAFQNGDVTVIKWDPVDYEGNLGGYEIRYSPTTKNSFSDATPLTIETKGTNITTADLPPGSWRLYIKAVDRITKNKSVNAATATVTVTTSFNVIFQVQQSPDWFGTLTNYVKHYTGKLVVESTKDADLHTNAELFEQHVPYPEAQSIYESPEYDINFDDTVRSWGDVDSVLGPGKTGTADPQLQIDSKLSAGAYDGFENWSNGLLTARYIKHRIVQDNTKGVAVVNGFQPTVDILEHTEKKKDVTIAIAGTTVTFDQPFHTVPIVKLFLYEQSAKQPVIEPSTITTTSFKAYVYALGTGSDVGGQIQYEATGE